MDPARIIKLVRDFAAVHGEDISEKLFVSLSGVSSLEIAEHFTTWKGLRVAAGLAPAESNAAARTTRDDIVAALQSAVEKHGPRLTLQTFLRETGLNHHVLYDRCGSWSRLRRDAGLTARANAAQPFPGALEPGPGEDRITAGQILDRLRAEVREHGENISFQEFLKLTGCRPGLILNRFGRWSNLRRAAGLSPRAEILPRLTRDDLLDDLLQVYRRTGGNPKSSRYSCDGGRVSSVTICSCFGSWRQALAALHEERLGGTGGETRSTKSENRNKFE